MILDELRLGSVATAIERLKTKYSGDSPTDDVLSLVLDVAFTIYNNAHPNLTDSSRLNEILNELPRIRSSQVVSNDEFFGDYLAHALRQSDDLLTVNCARAASIMYHAELCVLAGLPASIWLYSLVLEQTVLLADATDEKLAKHVQQKNARSGRWDTRDELLAEVHKIARKEWLADSTLQKAEVARRIKKELGDRCKYNRAWIRKALNHKDLETPPGASRPGAPSSRAR